MHPMQPSAAFAAGRKTIANSHPDHRATEDLYMVDMTTIPADRSLPPDIDAMRRRLQDVHEEVTRFSGVADGLIFGKVGVDGLIGLIPGVGGVYSVYGGVVLLIQAIKAKCSLRTILLGIMMVAIDVVVGILPVGGDIADMLFRSHAWFGGMILNEVDAKLAYVARAEQSLAAASPAEHERQVKQLGDYLFRSGKSQMAVYVRLALVTAVCLFLVQECRRAQEARQETIRVCEARGGWFCSVRN